MHAPFTTTPHAALGVVEGVREVVGVMDGVREGVGVMDGVGEGSTHVPLTFVAFAAEHTQDEALALQTPPMSGLVV